MLEAKPFSGTLHSADSYLFDPQKFPQACRMMVGHRSWSMKYPEESYTMRPRTIRLGPLVRVGPPWETLPEGWLTKTHIHQKGTFMKDPGTKQNGEATKRNLNSIASFISNFQLLGISYVTCNLDMLQDRPS
jgi:hypothetical protein